MPNQNNLFTVRSLAALAAFFRQLPTIGAEAYANGGLRGRPIVERHFTAGNQARYGWAALTPKYAAFKAGRVTSTRRNLRAAGRVVPRGGGLPMLVGPSTLGHTGGLLRAAVADRKHRVTQTGDVALCHFEGLPDYSEYLHTGTGKMPKRSPVDPSTADNADLQAEMKKALDARVAGVNRKVPISADTIPGQARIVS